MDEITAGGLPKGRSSLVCGSAGCGKTLLALEFLVNGARIYGEPGVFVAFEETPDELIANSASLKFGVDQLIAKKMLELDHVRIEPSEIEETGEYDLEGLFLRLQHDIDSVHAKRVVLDTIEALFAGFRNEAILRAELRRLFRWLKDKGVTSIITAERGEGTLTRQGLEEYVADCVILLDNRVQDQVSTRRLRIVKYRGSSHGSNEYPFLIDEGGFSVMPITSLGLKFDVSSDLIPSGIQDLDRMLGLGGYFRGSSVLLSGTAGTGKTTVAASLARQTCARGERCLFFSFEESPEQITRNMRSVGIDLRPALNKGLLRIVSNRAFFYGLEMHLVSIHREVNQFKPSVVIIDPITAFTATAAESDGRAMVTRLIDFLKSAQITALFTNLTSGGTDLESTTLMISSLIDTWLLLRDIELNGERNRGLFVLKSRGMPHSNQIREFVLTTQGVKLIDAYLGNGGVLTGSSRIAQEAREHEERIAREEELTRKIASLERRRQALDAQIAAMRADFAVEEVELQQMLSDQRGREKRQANERLVIATSRKSNGTQATGESH